MSPAPGQKSGKIIFTKNLKMQKTMLRSGFGGPGPLQNDSSWFSWYFEFGKNYFRHDFDAFLTVSMFFQKIYNDHVIKHQKLAKTAAGEAPDPFQTIPRM